MCSSDLVEAAGCSDIEGRCVEGARLGCQKTEDCAEDKNTDGPFCVGVAATHPGYCSPAFGLHQGDCWDDSGCGEQEACLGSAPCPPGRRCRSGGLHAGFCGPFPADGTGGVEIRYEDTPGQTPRGRAVIHNGLPVAIVFPACYALNLEAQKSEGVWPPRDTGSGLPNNFVGELHDPLCNAPQSSPPVRLPAGGARVLAGAQIWKELPTSRKRWVLIYQMGCDGKDLAVDNCRVLPRVAFSAEYL